MLALACVSISIFCITLTLCKPPQNPLYLCSSRANLLFIYKHVIITTRSDHSVQASTPCIKDFFFVVQPFSCSWRLLEAVLVRSLTWCDTGKTAIINSTRKYNPSSVHAHRAQRCNPFIVKHWIRLPFDQNSRGISLCKRRQLVHRQMEWVVLLLQAQSRMRRNRLAATLTPHTPF